MHSLNNLDYAPSARIFKTWRGIQRDVSKDLNKMWQYDSLFPLAGGQGDDRIRPRKRSNVLLWVVVTPPTGKCLREVILLSIVGCCRD